MRLCELGPGVLTTSELFAILINPRGNDGGAATIAARVLGAYARGDGDGPLRRLSRASPAELSHLAAVPRLTAARLVSAVEIGRRAMEERLPARVRLSSGAEIYEYMRWRMRDLRQEECHLILLNSRSEATLRVQLTVGTADACMIAPREVFRSAVVEGASAIALVHNHPSGDPTPSDEDRRVTHALARAGEVMNIGFADHVIVGDDRYYSFHEAGELASWRAGDVTRTRPRKRYSSAEYPFQNPNMMSKTGTLLRLLQDVESNAGELADALDARDRRAARNPDEEEGADRFCATLAAAADRSLRILQAYLTPGEGEEIRRTYTPPGSAAELRAFLAMTLPDAFEWLVCARDVDPKAPFPNEARRIACYAAPGANEGHVVHVDAILASADGTSTVRQVLLGKTELGLEHALAVAALCSSLIHFRPSTRSHEDTHT